MKLAICNETYRDWDLARACEHAAGAGYDGLEIAPFTLANDPSELTERDAARAAEVVRGAGLEVVGLHWLLLRPAGLHVATPDDAVRARTVRFAQHLARLCGAMGGEVLVWGSPAQRSFDPGWDRAAATARAVDAWRAVAEVAAAAGACVCLEPLAASETNFVTSAAEGRELVRRVDHPAFRLHLDVKAMSDEREPIPEIIRASAGELRHFHANDPNLRGPGSGDVDYAPIAAALREASYDRWLSVEVFDYSPGPEAIAAESIEYLRSVFGR